MVHKQWIFFIVLIMAGALLAQAPPPQDSLTIALCSNPEQIVSRRTSEWRISYFMGETELRMKTINGFLSLNGASKPLYGRYQFFKVAGWVLVAGGVGLMFADGKIDGPPAPVLPLLGAAISVSGIVVGLKSNETFRLAIRAYNRDICNLK